MSRKYYGNDPNPVDEWGDPVKPNIPHAAQEPVVDEWGDPVRYVRVEQTPEEFVREKEKLALERELVRQGKIYPRSHYLPRGRFRGVLAVCLAFLFGIFICLGALVGVGAWMGTRAKIRQLLGANTDKWISPDYADMTVLDFVSAVIGDVRGGIGTLGDIAKYTPAVDSLLNTLGENTAALGIELTDDLKTKLKETPFSGIGAFLMDDVLKTVELGKVMKVTPSSDAMMIGLCYGEEGLDYTIGEGDTFVPVEGGRAFTTIGALMDAPTDLLSSMRLGTLLGLNKNVTEQALDDNAMMYALCYGKRGADENADADYYVKDGKVIVISDKKTDASSLADRQEDGGNQDDGYVHTFPTTVDALMHHSNAVINSLELGTMLGLDGSDVENNGVMYALSYGSRGIDWELDGNGKVVMLEGHDAQYPTKMKSFTESSSKLIEGMEIEALMNIKPDSNSLVHYLAYGTEMPKGEPCGGDTPWKEKGGKFYDKNDRPVDKNGYLLGGDGWYLTEEVEVTEKDGQDEVPTKKTQYKDGATFVYVYGEYGTVKGIEMLPDPSAKGFNHTDKATWKRYPKKKVSDLTDGDAKLVEGMKIGDAIEIDSGSSALMRAMKDWTIGELKQQDKIESLTIGDVLGEQGVSSKIMQALKNKTLGDMKDQKTIDGLKLSDVLEINDSSSGIMKAMRNWRLEDLKNQHRIDRLKIGNVITIGENSSSLMKAMKDWSISELADQDKIDSLTLGDVMKIPESGILHALADCPIGSMQARVDTLTLTEILGDSIGENKILKPLAGSTVKTLSSDMRALPIGTVFADEMFSYMKIEGDKTYQKLYTDYFTNHTNADYNLALKDGAHSGDPWKAKDNPNIPHPYISLTSKAAIKDKDVEKYRVNESGEALTLKYFTDVSKPETELKDTALVKTDPVIVMNNRDNVGKGDYTWETPYYYEERVNVTPVYAYMIIDYDTGKLESLPVGAWVEERPGIDPSERIFHESQEEGHAQYKIIVDGVDMYYTYTTVEDEKEVEKTVYLDYVSTGYKEEIPEDAVVRKDTAGSFYTKRVPLEARWADSKNQLYTEDQTTEKYRYQDGETSVELDRYLEGVWYLLLAHAEGEVPSGSKDGEGKPLDAKPGVITYNVSKPILDMDGLITEINGNLTKTTLWKLYFHGLLEDNPYYSFSNLKWLQGESGSGHVTFTSSDGTERTVSNLNDVEISEVVALVKGLIDMVNKIPAVGGAGS